MLKTNSMRTTIANSPNLNIMCYNFQEILELFQIPLGKTIDVDDLKYAKNIVLKMHPDKSRLPAEYFLFYKKAFDIVVEYYKEENKIHLDTTNINTDYAAKTDEYENITARINEMEQHDFHDTFNRLFEENMKSQEKTKNPWFYQHESKENGHLETANSVSEMNQNMMRLKEQQRNSQLTKYRGVQDLCHISGSDLYSQTDNDKDSESDTYISSDVFSRLKYDDLRKVHRDESVLSISERDYKRNDSNSNVQKLQEMRSMRINPMDKTIEMKARETEWKKQLLEKAHQSKLQTLQYEEKNKNVLSHFLRLT